MKSIIFSIEPDLSEVLQPKFELSVDAEALRLLYPSGAVNCFWKDLNDNPMKFLEAFVDGWKRFRADLDKHGFEFDPKQSPIYIPIEINENP